MGIQRLAEQCHWIIYRRCTVSCNEAALPKCLHSVVKAFFFLAFEQSLQIIVYMKSPLSPLICSQWKSTIHWLVQKQAISPPFPWFKALLWQTIQGISSIFVCSANRNFMLQFIKKWYDGSNLVDTFSFHFLKVFFLLKRMAEDWD